ncbi:MAG: coenzyme F420-0:L-glutamate ligase [Chloroflexi bacterium]|nr:coenzyme F420-0:L-glutamate ligase [Chloroflexota bacterium]
MYEDSIEIIPLAPLPEVEAGADLGLLLLEAGPTDGFLPGDLVVVAQKVVSKSEGAVVDLGEVSPSARASEIAAESGRDPRLIEVILQQARRIVKFERGVLITETHHGLVCANSGVDASNVPGDERVSVLPVDPDGSALAIRKVLEQSAGGRVGVIISDSFNRPWREGSINVAIGVSGFKPLQDRRGESDDYGRPLRATVVSVADEIASAAQLVIGETGRRPAAIVRGYSYDRSDGSGRDLMRDPATDLFR